MRQTQENMRIGILPKLYNRKTTAPSPAPSHRPRPVCGPADPAQHGFGNCSSRPEHSGIFRSRESRRDLISTAYSLSPVWHFANVELTATMNDHRLSSLSPGNTCGSNKAGLVQDNNPHALWPMLQKPECPTTFHNLKPPAGTSSLAQVTDCSELRWRICCLTICSAGRRLPLNLKSRLTACPASTTSNRNRHTIRRERRPLSSSS